MWVSDSLVVAVAVAGDGVSVADDNESDGPVALRVAEADSEVLSVGDGVDVALSVLDADASEADKDGEAVALGVRKEADGESLLLLCSSDIEHAKELESVASQCSDADRSAERLLEPAVVLTLSSWLSETVRLRLSVFDTKRVATLLEDRDGVPVALVIVHERDLFSDTDPVVSASVKGDAVLVWV